MTKREDAGASLAQYIIIVALIGMAVFIAFSLLGRQIVENLKALEISYSDINKELDTSNQKVKSGTLEAGDLKGTTTDPVVKCVESVCAIDYGEFVLNGLPDNFTEYVQSSGTSGGTETLVSMFDQIADQLEEKGEEGAAEYKKLANLGHFLSDFQQTAEETTNECANSNIFLFQNCYKSQMKVNLLKLDVPDDIEDVMPADKFISAISSSWNVFAYDPVGSAMSTTNLGLAQYKIQNNVASCAGTPACAIANEYNKIMANPKYSDSLKGLTKELYLNIDDLSQKQRDNIRAVSGYTQMGDTMGTITTYDPITAKTGAYQIYYSTQPSNIVTPKTSKFTDMDSALICASAHYSDINYKCH